MITFQTDENEYKKNPDIRREVILYLKEWNERQPHLPILRDVDLIVFYHSCNYSMELTKTTIDLNYTLRTHLDLYFKNRDPMVKEIMDVFNTVLFAPLKQTTPEGYQVMYCRLLDAEPSHLQVDPCAKAFGMVQDLLQFEHGTYKGYVFVLDSDNFVFGHISRLSLSTMKNVFFFLQEALPVRLKGFHFLNTPSFMDRLMALMRPFMKKEFMDLLHFHATPETIYKFVPQQAFPRELGGKDDSFEEIKNNTIKRMRENRQLLIEEEKLRVEESLRPGKPKNLGEIFGVEGSFKKLEFD